MFKYLSLLAVLSFPACIQAQAPTSEHHVFLIGDAGDPELAPKNLEVLRQQIEAAGKKATLVFLGDNIYPDGLPPKDHPDREKQEEKLRIQYDITKNFKGKTVVLPGNHDWDRWGKHGWDRVEEQARFTRNYFKSKKVFYPRNGHPGPEEIKLADGIYLIVFDMQWMLHKWEKPLQHDPLLHKEPIDVIVDIGAMLEKHKNDHVILASHHPLYSYGEHGGKFSLKSHLFPLTNLNENLYLPLPVIGSLYPTYRATAGSIQDIPHPEYKSIRNAIEVYIKEYPNIIYAAGHEHSLQHIKKEEVNYVVSGSGCKTTYLKKEGKYLEFGVSRTGFAEIAYNKTGQASLQLWAADDKSPNGEVVYNTKLYDYKAIENVDLFPRPTFATKVVSAKASEQYDASKSKRRYMGSNYRDVWNLDVEVPVFNLTEEKGGLEIIKKGGGMQTNSLRLEASDGKQYVLRSVEKYANKALPHLLQETFAVDVVQDQISSSHPYGAYIIPPMAEALGIYHTNPKLVYIPNDGAFGPFRTTFANRMALFEERPKGDWSEAKFFGSSKDIVSSGDVQEELRDDNDNRVDEDFMVKNRLFDMVIGDWDRHEDQWRWASFKEGKGMLYRPIPRDRDQAFFVNEGILPKIASRKWAMAKIEGFNEEVRWAPGFNFNARYFDRLFMTRPDREDWQSTIKFIQDSLTDEVIENAIRQWPENVFAETGEITIKTIKARRDNLEDFGFEYYESLAKNVEILGTDKKELVLIQNLNQDQVQITIHKIAKNGKVSQVIYDRVFHTDDTKEVRIYGFAENDEFKISGATKSKVKVRLIGGKGKDEIYDLTEGKKGKNVKVYDKKNTKLETNQQSYKSRLSNRKDINAYNKYEFNYDMLIPLVYGSYNKDDGVFLGGGFMFTKHGWRKEPFASKHLLMADMSLASGAFNIRYSADFTNVIGKWNVDAAIDIKKPLVNNFFGIGNESVYDTNRDIDYYRLRIEDNSYRLGLNNEIGNAGTISIGVQQRTVEVEDQPGTFISSVDFNEFDTNILFNDRRFYSGFYSKLEFDTRDEKMFPSRGLYWESEASAYKGMNENANDYQHFHTNLGLYYSFQYPARVTLASRTGYAHNFGKFVKDEFYNGNTIGGRTNLRGYRKTRLYGRTVFYQNVDLRLKLFDFSSILFPGKFGLHGFYDVGRVWVNDEDSNKWHDSFGFGIWLAPLSKAAISLSYAFSPEENLISFDFGFFF